MRGEGDGNSTSREVAKRRLTLAARRLGTENPVDAIGGLIDRSFELPVGDPRYGHNELTPGYMPIEHSFSEMAGQSLRLDMEPLGPQATPHARQQEASREMRRLLDANFGKPALDWFDRRSEPWRGMQMHGKARFGAWFGMGTDASGLQEARSITGARASSTMPPTLQHAAAWAMACLPAWCRSSRRSPAPTRGAAAASSSRRPAAARSKLRCTASASANQLGSASSWADGSVLPEGSRFSACAKGIEMSFDVGARRADPPPQMRLTRR